MAIPLPAKFLALACSCGRDPRPALQFDAGPPKCNTWCYTCEMPTTRPRHPVTETDEIAEILDDAARRWPDVARAKLIQCVMADWAAGGRSPSARSAAREALVGSLPGSADSYDRSVDWPE